MKSNRMGYPSSEAKASSIFPFEKIATLGREGQDGVTQDGLKV